MYSAELHSHSNHSRGTKVIHEGLNSPKEMVEHAKEIGLDILAITDHNKVKGSLEAKKYAKKYCITVIPGEEVSSREGHILGLGIEEEIKPGLGIEETIERIHSLGGVAIAAHPFDVKGEGCSKLAVKCDAVEIFNALNVDRVANYKSKKFVTRKHLPYIAGSDAHSIEMLGYGRTLFRSSDIDSILRDIRKGQVEISCSHIPAKIIMEWGVNRLKLSSAYVINYMNENYSWPKRYVCRRLLSLVDKSPGSIDYLFKIMTYFSLGSVILYSAARGIAGVR